MKNTFGLDDAVIPIFYPSNLVRWLESLGYDRAAMIENTGLAMEDIDSPDVLVTFRQHKTLILNTLRITDDPHLGLRFGQQIKLTAMGIAGYAAMSSDNLLEALEVSLKYTKLRAPLLQISLEKNEDTVSVILNESLDYGPIKQFMFEAFVSSASVMYGDIGISGNPASRAKLTISTPERWEEHKHLLAIPVEFEQERNEIIISREFLNQKSILADPVTAKAAKKICDEQLQAVENREGLISRINGVFQNRDNDYPSLSDMAEQLCVSPRTLRRELQKLDTTYQTLLDRARKTQAIGLLKNSDLTIQEIAIKMGYTDPANFGRAFRKWAGKAPGAFRK